MRTTRGHSLFSKEGGDRLELLDTIMSLFNSLVNAGMMEVDCTYRILSLFFFFSCAKMLQSTAIWWFSSRRVSPWIAVGPLVAVSLVTNQYQPSTK
jgi:hypothetical protein